jgi:hypothetical protein
VALFLAVTAALLVVGRLGRRSGATTDEVRARLPGDDLVPQPMWTSTRAITIEAAPADVWPWIVQMGYPSHRAGWYTPHWLDRLQWGIRERSSGQIRQDLQRLEVGDRVPDSRDWSVYFTVAGVEPERALVLHSTRHLMRPLRAIDFSWAFVLQESATGATRLIMRARVRGEPRAALVALTPLVGVGDVVNASAMLRGIKVRVESARGPAGRRSAADTREPPASAAPSTARGRQSP